MAPARMLLVEDDPMLRRFVRMALEALPLELLECDSVAPALQILAAQPVQLILTDLMLPGASGVDLLLHLQQHPALRGTAKVVVFSAGLTPETRLQLAPLQVWRLLEKPTPIAVLEQCVREALAVGDDSGGDSPPPAAAPASDRHVAIDQYFGGDAELFHLYRNTCMAQFPHDLAAGDRAANGHDLPTLRRVAHSLKTVLLTIDLPVLAAQARALESTCHTGAPDAAARDWPLLRAALADFVKNQGSAQY
ncbi:response regulator [Rhodoferax sp. WC2427]|uniref:response regulator n=1 Tax=Rhodoferax sp. WC2427 TaxID=3234144 RepID=UPI003466FA3C